MAAHGAAVSLLKNLTGLEISPNYLKSRIELLREGICSLKCFLDENREVKREFEAQIREAIYEAEDFIYSYALWTHSPSPSQAGASTESFCQDLKRVEQRISSIAQMTKTEFDHQTLDRKIKNSLFKSPDEIDCKMMSPLMGRGEDLTRLKGRLMKGPASLQVVPIVGVSGMGKTALAHSLLEDQFIRDRFDATYWAKVPTKYNKRDVLLDLLGSIKKRGEGIRQETQDELIKFIYNWSDVILQKTDEQLETHLYNALKYKRYLVLLDDIREIAVWNDLKHALPDHHNGSRIMLTTRNMDVAPSPPHQLNPISDLDTLRLLWNRIFSGKPGPINLLITAIYIAQSCRGLPRAVVIVGNLLSCAKPDAEYWEIVLSSINTCENYDDLTESLISLTYMHLPQDLKVGLLHMAICPYQDPIPLTKIAILWAVENFLEDLRTLTMVIDRGLILGFLKDNDETTIGSAIADEFFHDFLVKKAQEEKFFLVIDKDTSYDLLREDTTYNQQRRLSIQQNIHHFMKNRPKNNSNPAVRSLFYYGPKLQFPLSAWLDDFKLLEILDAVKLNFYTFPTEIFKSFRLKYLALSYNGELPAALCNLQSLQFLNVAQYLSLKCSGIPSYLPTEIWNMIYLASIHVMGRDLPEPPSGTDTQLKHLFQLSGVSAQCCTQNIFEKISHLKILEVRIESLPEDESLSFFGYLGILNQLLTFECVVMYPDIRSQVIPCSFPILPYTLKKLTLSGCGFPWEYVEAIASLPGVRHLRLRACAFQGPEWEVKTNEFPKLKYLLLEDMDFEKWTITSGTRSGFPILKRVIIRHCYKLRRIPSVFQDSLSLETLEVVDCSTSAMNSALEINEKLSSKNDSLQFNFYSSLDD